MKANVKYLMLCGFCILLVSSCKKGYLEQEVDGRLPAGYIWTNAQSAFGFLNNAYTNIQGGYMRVDGAMLASASDEAKHSADASNIQEMVNGAWNAINPVENLWGNYYDGIRKVNLFMENVNNVPLLRQDNVAGIDTVSLKIRERMKGEARFLRAYFYFELMKRYGGVPLVLKSLGTEDDIKKIPRASIKECLDQIVLDCDSAVSRLPLAYTGSVPQLNDVSQTGRATIGAAMALKARALLYYASPLFNPNNDVTRWEAAAVASKAVMDLGNSSRYSLLPIAGAVGLNNIFYEGAGAKQYHNEIIFSTSYSSSNDFEKDNSPLIVNGRGLTNPTQEMVNAFGMKNGLPITDPLSGYSPQNPFVDRDPRFYAAIRYHGEIITQNDKKETLNIAQGVDKVNSLNATRTGYYLAKFIAPTVVWDLRSFSVSRTSALMRFAEVLLNYAEAKNEALSTPDASVYAAVEKIRQRAGLAPYKLPIGLNKEQMREIIRNERRVELCFEEHRFFDVRRWKLYGNSTQTIPVTGVTFNQSDNTFSTFTVENRVWEPKMYWVPIPQAEVFKSENLPQNPGW